MIKTGQFKRGDKFPTEPELMKEYNVSCITVRNAVKELVNEGLLYREQGKGTFVRDPSEKKEKTIGIIIFSVAEGVFPELVLAMEETTHRLGYSVILCNSQKDFEKEEEYTRRLISRKVAGVIFDPILSSTQYERNVACINRFLRAHIPVVTRSRLPNTVNALDYDSVDINNMQGAYGLINHLIELGHKRIGVLSDPFNPDVEERIEGYKKALRENGIEFDPDLIKPVRVDLKEELDSEAVKGLLKMKCRPTAIFGIQDGLAHFVMKLLMSEGVSVPEDMAVVGFDDLDFSSELSVPLTTARWSRSDLGRIAVEMLIERIEGKRYESKHILLPTELIIRQSCGEKNRRDTLTAVSRMDEIISENV